MKKQIPLTAAVAVGVAIAFVAGFVVLVNPQRDEGKRLDAEVATLEAQVAQGSRPAEERPKPVEIRFAELFQLAKAMPDEQDMPGIILELDSIASATGVKFRAIAPQPELPRGLYRALPITLTFEGNYYDLTDFLYRVRSLVSVRDEALDVSGRLYTLDTLDMHESSVGFPTIEATLTLSAYVFGPGTNPAPVSAGEAAAAPAATTSAGSTTPAEPSPASTAPAETPPAAPPAPPTEPPAPAPGAEALNGRS